jgi:hypothetical protein
MIATVTTVVSRTKIGGLELPSTTSRHPDSSSIVSPRFPLKAAGFAQLLDQANTASRICLAVLCLPIIGLADDGSSSNHRGGEQHREYNDNRQKRHSPPPEDGALLRT